MAALGSLLLFIACILALISWIWFIIEAFKVDILWGLACLFLPIVPLIFLIFYWDKASKPFWLLILALLCSFAGGFLAGQGV
ncbi:MAG: hypothetical protein MK193_12190 [Lentisphaeria bacterium]|nr:hypothetical protein [Lentisphaeria bacterium]